ncbi:recombinase family protein [Sphingomonas koreensis]|nr:recombinase family protein [Sphingomonas koreensis]
MNACAERHGFELVAFHDDNGIIGATTGRPGVQAMPRAVARAEAKVVIIEDVDRHRNEPRRFHHDRKPAQDRLYLGVETGPTISHCNSIDWHDNFGQERVSIGTDRDPLKRIFHFRKNYFRCRQVGPVRRQSTLEDFALVIDRSPEVAAL